MEDQPDYRTQYAERRARERAWLRAQLFQIAGMIDGMSHENDSRRRQTWRERLVDAFVALSDGPPEKLDSAPGPR
jgi:hypothetical protein